MKRVYQGAVVALVVLSLFLGYTAATQYVEIQYLNETLGKLETKLRTKDRALEETESATEKQTTAPRQAEFSRITLDLPIESTINTDGVEDIGGISVKVPVTWEATKGDGWLRVKTPEGTQVVLVDTAKGDYSVTDTQDGQTVERKVGPVSVIGTGDNPEDIDQAITRLLQSTKSYIIDGVLFNQEFHLDSGVCLAPVTGFERDDTDGLVTKYSSGDFVFYKYAGNGTSLQETLKSTAIHAGFVYEDLKLTESIYPVWLDKFAFYGEATSRQGDIYFYVLPGQDGLFCVFTQDEPLAHMLALSYRFEG